LSKILRKRKLTPDSTEFIVDAPVIAKKARAGNFVIVRIHDRGERVPLTIADSDPKAGTITLIFQEVGKSTIELATFNEGDEIHDLVGPLGKVMEVGNVGEVLCVGGGLGIAPLYPKVKHLKEEGNTITIILGARSKNLLILEDEMKKMTDRVYITTDDGTYGMKGFVSDQMKVLFDNGYRPDLVIAVGPCIMMKVVCALTKNYNLRTLISADTIMVDGTGMCGSCRLTVGGKSMFACVDGPMFDGHLVDFDEYMVRQRRFNEEEKCALERYLKERGITTR